MTALEPGPWIRIARCWPAVLCAFAACVACQEGGRSRPADLATAQATGVPARAGSASAPTPTASQRSHSEKSETIPSPPWLPHLGRGSVKAERGIVSSVESHATEAGLEVLRAGGNAVDAAVAVGFALAVTHPSAGNLGGGGFALTRAPDGQISALDFREQAPSALTQTFFDKMIQRKARGPQAAAIPGSVAGLLTLHQRFGRLSRQRIMAPAIRLASEGIPLGERQALVLSWAWRHLSQEAQSIFHKANSSKRPLSQGETLRQPMLARTLQRISQAGNSGFYSGPTALAMVNATQALGGIFSAADLGSYRAKWRSPLQLDYHGAQVFVMPPPSAGGVAVVQMLSMFESLSAEKHTPASPEGLHLFAEVAKRAHAERRFEVVDPDSVEGYDPAPLRKRWATPEHWLKRFPIRPGRATPARSLHGHYDAAVRELDNTTHFATADAEGWVVSCTTTLSASFGSKYLVPELGVVLNNSLAAFGTVGADVPKPGRRMTSSMSPTLLSAGNAVLALGSPGGDTIPNTIVQVLRNVVDYGMPLRAAIEAPRVHHGFVPDALRTERLRPIEDTVKRRLQSWGHQFTKPRRTTGDANNVALTEAGLFGVADPREGGLAAGF